MSGTRPPNIPSDDPDRRTPVPLPPRYRFEAALGEGGLGTVVKAYDTQLRTHVAIKTIRHELASIDRQQYADLRERFQREALAGARPSVRSSPYIVTVYDQIVDEAGNAFLVLEFVPGGTLHDRLVGGPLPMAAALRLTADTARGLQDLHEADLVHRDIKPENIFIAANGRAMVGDLGVVQMSTTTFRTRLDYGSPQGHPGTPMYMSPEQALTTDVLMPEADQYSLGAVLFEVVTGKRFKGIYRREREAMLDYLPAGVAMLIRRMTATEAEDRYPGMGAVLQAIQAIDWSDTTPAPSWPAQMPPTPNQWQRNNEEWQWAEYRPTVPDVMRPPYSPPMPNQWQHADVVSQKRRGRNYGIGFAFGIPMGVALGVALGNLTIGLGIGVAIGVILGKVKGRREDRWRARVTWLAWRVGVIVVVLLFVRLETAILIVDGNAMQPSIKSGQLVLENRLAYRNIELGGKKYYLFRPPKRGDVIIYRFPVVPYTSHLGRIIGVPGDTVLIRGGEVIVNDVVLNELYISEATRYFYPVDGRPYTLKPDEYFVLGDNRNASEDSHFFGPIHANAILGKT